MTNWDLYNYIHGGKSGSNATADEIISRRIESIKNDRVTNIGAYAFQGCTQLTSADFPNATSIGTQAFRECSKLTSADFPNATSIGTHTFRECSQLSSVNFPSVTSIGAHAFRDCPQLSSVNFLSVTSIGDYAFGNCKLTSVDFPNATSIGAHAFYGCTRLTSIKLASSQVVTLGSANAFERTPFAIGGGFIYVPDDLVESYKTATNWTVYAEQIKGLSQLPEGV